MRVLAVLLILLVTAMSTVASEVPKVVTGQALVVDGDGLRIGEWEIRLLGIDAPGRGRGCLKVKLAHLPHARRETC